MTTNVFQRAIGVGDCSCGCGDNCSCVTLERFRQLAMSNIEPELFWGLASTGNVQVVEPGLGYGTSKLICYPGPQLAEQCTFAGDGTYHCSGGTHGTWDPGAGPPPDFSNLYTVERRPDGTWVDHETGTTGTWIHANGTVDPTHTGIQCTVQDDGVTYVCTDGSTGTVNSSNGIPPIAGAQCTSNNDGTYSCTDGSSGTYLPIAFGGGGGSNPSVNPNVECVHLPDGSFICDDGTIGLSYSAGGSTPAPSPPNASCTYLPDGTYTCPDGSNGVWGWSGPQGWTAQNGNTSSGSTGGDYSTYLPVFIGYDFQPDGTYTAPDGTTGAWMPIVANDVIDDPGATFNDDGTYVDSSGNTGIYLPIIIEDPVAAAAAGSIAASGFGLPFEYDPNTPILTGETGLCTFYEDGTFVCADGTTGSWFVPDADGPQPGEAVFGGAASNCTYYWSYDDEGNAFRAWNCPNGLSGVHLPPLHSTDDGEGGLVGVSPEGLRAMMEGLRPEVGTTGETAPVECSFGVTDGSWSCTDGTSGNFFPDTGETPSNQCLFYVDGTYRCPDGSTGTWSQNDIEQIEGIFEEGNAGEIYSYMNATDTDWIETVYDWRPFAYDDPPFNLPTGGPNICFLYSNGRYRCTGGDEQGWVIPDGNDPSARCYYITDGPHAGQYRCDDGFGGYWDYGEGSEDGLNPDVMLQHKCYYIAEGEAPVSYHPGYPGLEVPTPITEDPRPRRWVCNDGTNGTINSFMEDPDLIHEPQEPVTQQVGPEVCTYYPEENGWRCVPGTLGEDEDLDDSDQCVMRRDGTSSCPDGSTYNFWTPVPYDPSVGPPSGNAPEPDVWEDYPSFEEATTGEGSDVFLPLVDTGYGDPQDLIDLLEGSISDDDADGGNGDDGTTTGGGGGGGGVN